MEWKKVSRVNIITIFFMHFWGSLDATRYNISQDFAFVVFPIAWKKYLERFVSNGVWCKFYKPPPGINPIKHEVPPGYFVSTLPHCAQCSTLCIISFCCTTIVNGFRGLEMALIMGGTVHHLAINNSREMTASKDFKRLKHKNLRHFNFFYQDVICIGHQPSSLSDCCQCWYWGGLPDNSLRNNEILSSGN